ncbi:hypothetical protein [Streptomyces sp. 1222.5]|uniref:hypothetical protein n=1 Tax=Streptomyces sp. 1222.5 TaxID=1881026 RepID=UPI003EBF9A3F
MPTASGGAAGALADRPVGLLVGVEAEHGVLEQVPAYRVPARAGHRVGEDPPQRLDRQPALLCEGLGDPVLGTVDVRHKGVPGRGHLRGRARPAFDFGGLRGGDDGRVLRGFGSCLRVGQNAGVHEQCVACGEFFQILVEAAAGEQGRVSLRGKGLVRIGGGGGLGESGGGADEPVHRLLGRAPGHG